MEGTYAMRRAYSGIRMAIRVAWAPLLESARALSAVGSIGRDVVQMWQAYTLGQYRIERAARDVSDAQQDVVKWQQLYNQYLRDFGSDAAFTKDALDNLTAAQNNLNDVQAAAAKAQNDMNMGYVGMVLESTGVVASLVDVAYHIRVLNALMLESGGVAGGLGAGLGGLGVAFGGLGTAISGAGDALAAFVAGSGGAITALILGLDLIRELNYQATPEETRWQIEQYEKLNKEVGLPNTQFGGSLFRKLFPVGQYGVEDVPETGLWLLHKHERVLNPEQTRRERVASATRPIVASVTQYNTITQKADADAAADRAYRKLLDKFANKS